MQVDLSFLKPEERRRIYYLAEMQQLPVERLVVQALRLYDMHQTRLEAGETCTYSGDADRARKLYGTLKDVPPDGTAIIVTGDSDA